MGTNSRCRIKTLASSEICAVAYCPGCGMFHVSVGMFTMRFKLATLHLLNSTLTTSLETYKRQQTGQLIHSTPAAKPGGSLH